MSKWVTESMKELLQKINDVPFADDREGQQLTILMNGVAMINNKAMDNAATKTRETMRNWDLDSAEANLAGKKDSNKQGTPNKGTNYDGNDFDELTRLRPIR